MRTHSTRLGALAAIPPGTVYHFLLPAWPTTATRPRRTTVAAASHQRALRRHHDRPSFLTAQSFTGGAVKRLNGLEADETPV